MTPLSLGNAALVISECQRGVLDADLAVFPGIAEHAATRGLVDNIAVLAEAFRSAGRPVVHCLIEHREDLAGILPNSLLGSLALKHRRMIVGTPDAEVPEPIAPRHGDFVSSRATGITAFYGTDLDATLRLQHIDTLVVSGVSTNVALPGMTMEAVNRGYWVVIPEDATAGNSPETHRFMVDNLLSLLGRMTTTEEVVDRLST
jgi:nicotinamidase-related amidase